MRRKFSRLLTIFTLVVMAFGVTAWAVSFVKGQSNGQQSQDTSNTRVRTLREIAQERDVEISYEHSHTETEYSDLRWLAENTHAVVMGKIVEAKPSFSGDNNIITTYAVDVQRVLKQPQMKPEELNLLLAEGYALPPALTTPLRFVRPGGLVHVNGRRVKAKAKGQEALVPNKTYIFFLEWSSYSKTGRYLLTGGISGAVLIEDDLRVKPLGTNDKLKRKAYDQLSLEAFIQDILEEPTQ